MKISILEFDDPGAGDDEPVKGVTMGHIRAWHDSYAELEHEAHRDYQALEANLGRLSGAINTVLSTFEKDEAQGYRSKDRQFAIDILRKATADHLPAQPQAASRTAPREMWAMLYLHDWDPPKEGQEHRWEPGKNVFPEIHAVYETLRDANTILSRMSDPKKYWVRRVWMPAHDTPSLSRPERA